MRADFVIKISNQKYIVMRKFFLLAFAAMMSLASAAQTKYPVTVVNPAKGGTLTLTTTEVAPGSNIEFTYVLSDGYVLEYSDLLAVNTETGAQWVPGSMMLDNGVGSIYFDQTFGVTLMPKFKILRSYFTETKLKDGIIELHWEKRGNATYELYVLKDDPNLMNGIPADAELIQLTDTFYTAPFPKDRAMAFLYLRVCLSDTEKSEWTPSSVDASGKVIRIDMQDAYGDGWNGSSFAAVYPDGTERRICIDDYSKMNASILLPWADGIKFMATKRGSYMDEVYLNISCPWDGESYEIAFGDFKNEPFQYAEGKVFWTYETPATLPADLDADNNSLNPVELDVDWVGGFATSWNVVFSKAPVDAELLDTLIMYHASDAAWKTEHGLTLLTPSISETTFIGDEDTHYYYYIQGVNGGLRSDWVGDEFLTGGRVPTPESIPELHPASHFSTFTMEDAYISAPAGIMSETNGRPYRIFKYTPEQDTVLIPYMPNYYVQWEMSSTAWDATDYYAAWSFSLTAGNTYYFIYISDAEYDPQSYGLIFLTTELPERPIAINYFDSGRLTNENTEARDFDGSVYTKAKYLGSYTPTEDSITIMYYDELGNLGYLYWKQEGGFSIWASGTSKKILKGAKPYHFFIAQDAEMDYAMRIVRVFDPQWPHATQDTIKVGDIVCDTKKEGMMETVYETVGYNFVDVFTHDFQVDKDTFIYIATSSPTLDSMQVLLTDMKDSTILIQQKLYRKEGFFTGYGVTAGTYRLAVACMDEELKVGESICTRVTFHPIAPLNPDLIETLQLNEKKTGAVLDLTNDFFMGVAVAKEYRLDLTDSVYVRLNSELDNQAPMQVLICKDSLGSNIFYNFDEPRDFVKLGDTTYFVFVYTPDPYEIEGLGAWTLSLDTMDSYHLRPFSENIPLGKMVSGSLKAGEKELYNINENTPFFPAQDYNVQVEKDKMYRFSLSFEASADAEFLNSSSSVSDINIALLTSGELKGGYDDFNGDKLYYDYFEFYDTNGKESQYFTASETGAMRLYIQPWLLKGSVSYTLLCEELTAEQPNDTITLNALIKKTSETMELPISATSSFLPKSTFVEGKLNYFRSDGNYYHATAYRTSLLVGEEVAITMKSISLTPWVEVYRVMGGDTVRVTSGYGEQSFGLTYVYYKESFIATANADYYIVCTTASSGAIGDWSVAITKGSLYNNPDIYDVPTDELIELSVTPASLKLHGSKKATVMNELVALTLKAGEFDLVNKAEYWSVDLAAGKASILYPASLLPSGYAFAKDKDKVDVALSFYWNVTFLNANGGTIVTKQVDEGTAAVAPDAPAKEGYDFKGWDTDFSNVTADLTVNPLFTIKTFTVKFVDWDDTTLKTETVEWDKDATAPAEPTRSGYTFIGWDKSFKNVKENLTVKATYKANSQGIDEVQDASGARKVLRDGQLYIEHNGKTYNAQGARL